MENERCGFIPGFFFSNIKPLVYLFASHGNILFLGGLSSSIGKGRIDNTVE